MKVQRFLDGVAIQFYRGIGPEMQKIGPFKEMNFFIGANNAGKSIVLKFIHERLPFSTKGNDQLVRTQSNDSYIGDHSGKNLGAVAIPLGSFVKKIHSALGGMLVYDEQLSLEVSRMFDFFGADGHVWVSENGKIVNRQEMHAGDLFPATAKENWEKLLQATRYRGAKNFSISQCENVVQSLIDLQGIGFPISRTISAKRSLENGFSFLDENQGNPVLELAQLQNPSFRDNEKRALFKRINKFLREVTGKQTASLEIPFDRDQILVHIDNKVLPLENLGTGIHEVVLIAAFCTIHQDQIICIEEPEIHLHPHLQRKLMAYLRDNTTNQYFIATHSAALIDTEGAAVFRVRNDGVQTYVEPAFGRADGWRICGDLGYRASDILQANMVIWVEGPSDRIYLKHWIDATREGLVEGIHYTILFYGGGLVSHLSAEVDVGEDLIRELVDLRGLSAHMAIVMDSDRAAEGDDFKPAVQRLVSEVALENEGEEPPRSMVWVTAGREIENYVPHDTLQAALKQRHPVVYGKPLKEGPFEHAFHFERKDGEEVYTKGDKVGAAKIVCETPADLDILDLKARIEELVALICRANTLSN